MSRVVALIVVVAGHLALIAMFTASRKLHGEIPDEGRTMTVVFLSPMSAGQPVSRLNPASEANRSPNDNVSKRAPSPNSPPPPDSAAITPQLSEVEETPSSPSIDWSKEAELAASRQIDSLEDGRRRAGGFMPREANHDQPPRSKPEFGWSRAQTHRIEPLPDGGMLLRINERCALVISTVLLPVCKIGKIEARGDLFEHMRDAREPGDWKQ